jgi:glycosyltransferase involved in cell wall biosynthesis
MHVLFLPSWYSTPEAPWSGTFFESQAGALARAGARVGVAFVEMRSLRSLSGAAVRQSHFQTAWSEERGVTCLRLKAWNPMAQTTAGAKIWALLSQRLVRTYVQRFGTPDVIHAQAALWAGRVAVRTARTLSRPSVVTEHSTAVLRGALRPSERAEAAAVYREANAVLAVSHALSKVIDVLAGTSRCRVVPNVIDFEFFTLPPVPRQQDPFTFLCVCNLIIMHKRVDRLIRAFARVAAARPGTRLVIVGSGPDEQALRALAHECGVASHVEFTGGLPPERVRGQMWTANALVLPSAFETFGVVLVEALATGIPVISTRCGGPDDIVEPGLGTLVEPDDDEGLAPAMLAMTAESYSEQVLRERAKSRYSFEKVAGDLLTIYASLDTGGQLQGYHGALKRPNEGPFST